MLSYIDFINNRKNEEIMIKPKIGLLLLYLRLYDKVMPELRSQVEEFAKIIGEEFKKREVEVLSTPVCCVENEFKNAIKLFESQKVDAVVTLHLAYSPSLESVNALSKTKIPIIVLDTTPKYDFGDNISPEEIMYNHGIHGVQDMCNMLLRKKKDFFLEAGHWQKSDVIDRVLKKIKAASIARSISNMRVGSIGGTFKGMGDFYVPSELLKETIGIETIETSTKDISRLLPLSGNKEVEKELELDDKNYNIDKLSNEIHLDSIKIGLAVRKWIEKENLGAFTMNFSAIGKNSGFPTLPFLEASKAMGRGIGYAGEGDVITAALVGALLSIYPETSFVEMFCPDWEGNRIFLSHMGEMNIDLVSGKPKLTQKDLPFLDVGNPAIAFGRFKPGKAVFVNLAPSRELYTLIVSQVEMVEVKNDKMADTISGWFVPSIPIGDFLAEFSQAGGTHHSALVYGEVKDAIMDFGKVMGWKVIKL